MILTPPVLHMLGRQRGVASNEQLLERGVSARQLKRAVALGLLVPELPGVKRLAGTAADVPSRVMSLTLYVGDRGFVSGMAAARQHGVECVPQQYLEVMVPDRRDPQLPTWVTSTRSSWRIVSDRAVLADGRVVSSPLRSLFRCGATCPNVRFEKIAEQMWHRRLITPQEAAEYLQLVRRRGRHGVARFEHWLEAAIERPRPSHSGMEVDLAAAVVQAGLPAPLRQRPLVLPNGDTIHLDLAWDEVQLGVEPGARYWHMGDDKVRADGARDRGCDEIGWRVLRFDEIELRDVQGCARQIAGIYRQRQRQLRPTPVV